MCANKASSHILLFTQRTRLTGKQRGRDICKYILTNTTSSS